MSSSGQPRVVKEWTILNRAYIEYADGRQFSGRIDPKTNKVNDWKEVKADNAGSSSSTAQETKKLYLVLQSQAPGEPMHWSLFVSSGESLDSRGKVWQVKGDALLMHYQHAENVALLRSGSYYTSYVLNSDLSKSQESLIKEAAGKEKPPQAKNQRSVKENCQGWTIRVLKRLQGGNVVNKQQVMWVEKELKEPISK